MLRVNSVMISALISCRWPGQPAVRVLQDAGGDVPGRGARGGRAAHPGTQPRFRRLALARRRLPDERRQDGASGT